MSVVTRPIEDNIKTVIKKIGRWRILESDIINVFIPFLKTNASVSSSKPHDSTTVSRSLLETINAL